MCCRRAYTVNGLFACILSSPYLQGFTYSDRSSTTGFGKTLVEIGVRTGRLNVPIAVRHVDSSERYSSLSSTEYTTSVQK
ncbi:hypothetical protein GGX14DRAFT_518310, partial [Mycena pura]